MDHSVYKIEYRYHGTFSKFTKLIRALTVINFISLIIYVQYALTQIRDTKSSACKYSMFIHHSKYVNPCLMQCLPFHHLNDTASKSASKAQPARLES